MADDTGGYTAAYAWVRMDPEMAAIFDQAIAEKWAPDRFQAAIQGTNWWKTHQASERQWEAAVQSDPAQALALKRQKVAELQSQARQMGSEPDDTTLWAWAEMALRYGWTPTQQQDILASWWSLDQGTQKGAAATIWQDINALSSDYAITLSDATKERWTQQVLAGDVTVEEFKGYLSEMAASQWTGLKDVLSRGVTVRQFAEPFLQLAARELEIDPATIDLKDPKWQAFLDRRNDKGEWSPMSLREWRSTVRSDPAFGWDKTEGARQQSAELTTALGERFGVI